jgi:very-short-patch-repair endonuclease
MLWNYLKGKQMKGFDFDRQRPIDNYIVDFYCKDLQLAIEVDGESHYGNLPADMRREKRLNKLGVNVLRFDDMEIVYELDEVLKKIERWIDENVDM